MAQKHGSPIVTDGLVLCLDAGNPKSYPGSGSTWYDRSGNGYDGTLENGPAFNSKNGGVLVFDGSNDYTDLGVNLADIVGSNPTGISFVFFAKADDLTNPIGIAGDYTGPAGTGFGIKRSSSNNKLEFRCYGAGGRIPRSTTDIPTGVYFHGVCTWNSAGSLKIYFNGVLETTDNGSSSTWTHGNGDLRIGDIYGGMGVPAEWQGDIALFKIYNRTLTATEVLQNFNATKQRFNLDSYQ